MNIDDRVLDHPVDHGAHGDAHAEHAPPHAEQATTGAHGQHSGHGQQGGHSDHSDHAGMFRRRFWWSLLLSVPIVVTEMDAPGRPPGGLRAVS